MKALVGESHDSLTVLDLDSLYYAHCQQNSFQLRQKKTVGWHHILHVIAHRAIFTRVSKVICVYFGFTLIRVVIGLKTSRHFINQSQVKPKPIVTRSRKFSRVWCNCLKF